MAEVTVSRYVARRRVELGLDKTEVMVPQAHAPGAEAEVGERAAIAIGTNLPFSERGTVFPGPRLVAAIVDRVTFNAHILETGTRSCRLRTTTTASRSRKPR